MNKFAADYHFKGSRALRRWLSPVLLNILIHVLSISGMFTYDYYSMFALLVQVLFYFILIYSFFVFHSLPER